MSPDSVNLVFITTSEFARAKGKEKKTTNEYQSFFWSVNGLSVILYSEKLVVQGRLTEFTKPFIRGLRDVTGLTMDFKNVEKFMKLFPVRQNSIVCSKCGKDSLLMRGFIEGLDISFGMECGHKCSLVAPFLTLNNRVLPDINVICAKSVSRLINLGYLAGAEIVFPEFVLDVIDKFKGSGLKKAFSGELDNLRKRALHFQIYR